MTEVRTVSSTGGEKGVKPEQHHLIPVEALAEVARVYGVGAAKYAEHNWRLGYEYSKSYSAAQRHLQAFWGGEDRDPEMGTLHLGNAIFHLMALIVFLQEHPEFDDRYKPSPPPEEVVGFLNGHEMVRRRNGKVAPIEQERDCS